MNDAGGGVELSTLYIYLFWLVLDVLGCVGKLLIIAFRRMFDNANVSSTHPAIQFRVFDEWCRRRGRTNHLVYLSILARSWCSWMRWKAIDHSYQTNV